MTTRLRIGLAVALALTGGAVLFVFDPATAGFFPRCPLHLLTGLLCPGCGSQRALHALLHADVTGAYRHNALLVSSLPLLAYIGLRRAVAWRWGRAWPAPYTRAPWLVALVALTLAFFVLRNTEAFAFLAPPG